MSELMFQSAPDPKAGRYAMLKISLAAALLFQSAPDPKAGRYVIAMRHGVMRAGSFNPLPTRRPGDTFCANLLAGRR